MSAGNGEKAWLTWGFRGLLSLLTAVAVALIGWNLSVTFEISKAVSGHEQRLDGHDTRITGLEQWRNSAPVGR